MIPLLRHESVPGWFTSIFAAGRSPLLVGGTGKGKSSLAAQYAESRKLYPVIIYLDSMYEMDVIGYAHPDESTGTFKYLPCGLFPLESTPIPDGYKGFLLIFEEFGNCPKSMQVAAQRVILDKRIGDHKLHPTTKIMLLGNKVSSGANAIPISSAIRTRCGVAELDTSSMESFNGYVKYMTSAGFDPSVIEWVRNNPDVYTDEDRDAIEDGESPFCSNRGIEAVSDLMKKLRAHSTGTSQPLGKVVGDQLAAFQSLIGYARGSEFYQSVLNPQAGMEEIINDPLNAQIPSTAAETLRVANWIASNATTDAQVDSVVKYLNRVGPELRSSIVTKMTSASNFLKNHAAIENMMKFPF